MTPLRTLLLGVACLLAAQAVAWWAIAPRRAPLSANADAYDALRPGEFAGTLMLGGFRGLACDLLWMRGTGAKDAGRHYESVAVFEGISRIQPRMALVWEYLAWDMAYNLAHEVEDRPGKFAWFLAGLKANARGVERNPRTERILRHLAWMFYHKGQDFGPEIEAGDWSALLGGVQRAVDAELPPERRVGPLPGGPGASNYVIAANLYRICVRLGESGFQRPPAFVRRMIPLALEADGNVARNRGQHREALRRYLVSLREWEVVKRWMEGPPADKRDGDDQAMTRDLYERNEGRLRRKIAHLARELAPAAEAQAAADAVLGRRYADLDALLARPGWREQIATGRIQWLDEPAPGHPAP